MKRSASLATRRCRIIVPKFSKSSNELAFRTLYDVLHPSNRLILPISSSWPGRIRPTRRPRWHTIGTLHRKTYRKRKICEKLPRWIPSVMYVLFVSHGIKRKNNLLCLIKLIHCAFIQINKKKKLNFETRFMIFHVFIFYFFFTFYIFLQKHVHNIKFWNVY